MNGINKVTGFSHRIKVEKIDKDGNVEIIGDTGWISEHDRDLILRILELIDMELATHNLIMANKKYIDTLDIGRKEE